MAWLNALKIKITSVCLGADVSPSASYLEKHPPLGFKEQPKVLALGLARLRRVPSLRRRSVGPRRTDIHVLTALSRHPCRSAHSASSAFGLHPSRDWRRLSFLRMKITINSRSRSTADHDQQQIHDHGQIKGDQTLRTCRSELAREGVGTFTGFLVFGIQHSRASSLPQVGGDQQNCWRLDWPLPG